MKYYKVLDILNQSIMGIYFGNVQYEEGDWTLQPRGGGPLCVFDDLKRVKIFLKQNIVPEYRLWECVIEKSEEERVYYEGDWVKGYYQSLYTLPWGTVLCKKVKLIKEIALK